MRILFDQGTPAPLRKALPGHEVATAYEMGWSQLTNGNRLEERRASSIFSTRVNAEAAVTLVPTSLTEAWSETHVAAPHRRRPLFGNATG